jgi:hypothetical protein
MTLAKHQADESHFKAILPDDIAWHPFDVTQVTAIGPLGLEYIDGKDDRRK